MAIFSDYDKAFAAMMEDENIVSDNTFEITTSPKNKKLFPSTRWLMDVYREFDPLLGQKNCLTVKKCNFVR